MRNAAIDAALEASISRDRLAKYLAETNGDLAAAITLYEGNMVLSEAFYVPLQGLEVCLRNKLNDQLLTKYGDDWLTDPAAAPLDDHSRSFINDALKNLPTAPTAGQIVAELKFAFWVGLLAQKYDATLWRHAAHRAFLAGGGRPRRAVHGRMNAIRRFRNRVAHHEPIFHRDLLKVHEEVVESIGWMCAATRQWVDHHSRVVSIIST